MTGLYVESFSDDDDPDIWRDRRLDDYDDADRYYDRLIEQADNLRETRKEGSA